MTECFGNVSNLSIQQGLYIRAFCSGLDQVLTPYRQALLQLERDILADSHLPVTHVQCALEEFQLLFPALLGIIDQLLQHRAHGCQILEILHKNASTGVPKVKAALNQILHVCHGVFYKQLSAWMLHGLLLDQHEEFFITKASKEPSKSQRSVEDDDLGIAGVTGRQLQQIMQLAEDDLVAHYEQFTLRAGMLLSYIPTRVANKILFVGESVCMFSSENKKGGVMYKRSVLKNKEDSFAKALQELSQEEEFSLMSFENVIDKIRVCVAETLWKLVVEESDLIGHLRIIKDFYLLGRGELFLAFIDQSQGLLNPPPTGTTEQDVNMAFQHAARSVLFENEEVMQRFKLTVENKSEKSQTKKTGLAETVQSAEPGWNVLGLEYSVEWPLHLLTTESCLEKYNQLFSFLLLVKRVELDLQHCWMLHMNHFKQQEMLENERQMWNLRMHMSFLVDNLQYYLQVDVIESQFSILLEKIHTTRDFEAIRLAHDQFITSLLSQSFLLMKGVSRCLHEILNGCHAFCVLVSHSHTGMDERQIAKLEEIAKNFQRQSKLLFSILSSVKSHQGSPHLAQLLLRMDYNKYFSMAGGQLGSCSPIEAPSATLPSSSRR
ncbi:gamma-tubulin complex component 4 [Lingula anatina]|uniref:Gamma-tubulin complex component n=1 Tax=Lingula anatina TaxID=7574 RepID=A0A1S3IAP1_LINAN|nr:gamma-tubulin complex component 4 [Lingula anatina]|eukprot:XP_013394474.1 gamma-tubulin complex component 4 [Lingula anatina]